MLVYMHWLKVGVLRGKSCHTIVRIVLLIIGVGISRDTIVEKVSD